MVVGVIRFPVLRSVTVDSTTHFAVSVCWHSSAISEKIILPTLFSALGFTIMLDYDAVVIYIIVSPSADSVLLCSAGSYDGTISAAEGPLR